MGLPLPAQGVVEARALEDNTGGRYALVLLSRRSALHPGMRYIARGLNALASPGNEIECEQARTQAPLAALRPPERCGAQRMCMSWRCGAMPCMTKLPASGHDDIAPLPAGVAAGCSHAARPAALTAPWSIYPIFRCLLLNFGCFLLLRSWCGCRRARRARRYCGARMCGGAARCPSGGAWRSSPAAWARPPSWSARGGRTAARAGARPQKLSGSCCPCVLWLSARGGRTAARAGARPQKLPGSCCPCVLSPSARAGPTAARASARPQKLPGSCCPCVLSWSARGGRTAARAGARPQKLSGSCCPCVLSWSARAGPTAARAGAQHDAL